MNFKIVADSSADMLSLSQVDFTSVPLKITVGDDTYVDDENLNVAEMVDVLDRFKGRSCTACPSPQEWVEAFGEADRVFCVTITSNLSGCCNAAKIAARDYENQHPGRKVFVVDTLSTGPEMQLIVEKIQEWILAGKSYEMICVEIMAYLSKTRQMFVLRSIKNLANNGRVNPALATLVGLLGIRIVGRASDQGTLQQLSKSRGDKKALAELLSYMKELGYQGGRVLIHHCENLPCAENLKKALENLYPKAQIVIDAARGLCSFYAEKGGLLIGFETA